MTRRRAVFNGCSVLGKFCVLFLLLISRVYAEPPALDSFFPAGAERGTTNLVTAAGKFDSWPPRFWSSAPGLSFHAETNKGKFSIIVANDAAPGPRLVRLYNDDGASEPRILVVGDGHEMLETEPNNHFAKAQQVTSLPLTINGRLDKNGDVDSFAVDLAAGQWLDARVDCHTLMSKVDPVLRLVTTNGQQLAWNHDFTTLDPRLAWYATNGGTCVLQLFGFAYPPGSDIGLTGGESTAYRLHVKATSAPSAICRTNTEEEANDKPTGKARELPANITGTIGHGRDEDRFQFTAQPKEHIEARIEAASIGSPLDAWLKIEDESGNQIVRNDDADGFRDPRLEWKATNRNFVIAVGSVTHRGGSDFCYNLGVRQVMPDFAATASASSLTLTPEATNELKLEVKRLRGFTNTLEIFVRDLPEGVTLLTTNLSEKDSAIKLSAAADAAKFQGAVQIVVRDSVNDSERVVPFELTTRSETGYPRLLAERCDEIWLTVRPKPVEQKKAADKK